MQSDDEFSSISIKNRKSLDSSRKKEEQEYTSFNHEDEESHSTQEKNESSSISSTDEFNTTGVSVLIPNLTEMNEWEEPLYGGINYTKHYFLNKKMIEGAYGEIFLVKNKKTDISFVLKSGKTKNKTKGISTSSIREFNALLIFKKILKINPYIIDFSNWYIGNYSINIILPLYEGSLKDLIKGKLDFNITNKLVKDITSQLILGLTIMHEIGFIHRDIKSGNILVKHDFNSVNNIKVVIADFGMCVYAGTNLKNNSKFLKQVRIGTAEYLSPEIIKSIAKNCSASYGFPSDVWSLGMTLLKLYGGKVNIIPENRENKDFHLLLYKNLKKFSTEFNVKSVLFNQTQLIKQNTNETQIRKKLKKEEEELDLNSNDCKLKIFSLSDDQYKLVSKMLQFNPENRSSFKELGKTDKLCSNIKTEFYFDKIEKNKLSLQFSNNQSLIRINILILIDDFCVNYEIDNSIRQLALLLLDCLIEKTKFENFLSLIQQKTFKNEILAIVLIGLAIKSYDSKSNSFNYAKFIKKKNLEIETIIKVEKQVIEKVVFLAIPTPWIIYYSSQELELEIVRPKTAGYFLLIAGVHMNKNLQYLHEAQKNIIQYSKLDSYIIECINNTTVLMPSYAKKWWIGMISKCVSLDFNPEIKIITNFKENTSESTSDS